MIKKDGRSIRIGNEVMNTTAFPNESDLFLYVLSSGLEVGIDCLFVRYMEALFY